MLKTVKLKLNGFEDDDALKVYIDIDKLIADQEGVCLLTGMRLQFDGDRDDREMLCSLDRIDSDGHYEPGNLQIFRRFANRWKSTGGDGEFKRLLSLVRAVTV